MKFKLSGAANAKLGKHSGLFTHSYQLARARYDARIRNWDIEFRDDFFYVTNADGVTETCYFEPGVIHNCSCSFFAENECGTCMHLEAISFVNLLTLPILRIRPLTFVNKHGNVQNVGGQPARETPAVKTVTQLQQSRMLSYNTAVYPDVDIFKSFGINLYSFQKEAIVSMLKNVRSVLTLRMGLGKTICALVCCKLLDKQKVLIISPNSLKYQWAREIDRFKLGTSLVVSKGADLKKYSDQRFLIISYEMLNFNRQLLDSNFDILIADEIQKIKNQESETWKTVMKTKAEYVFALSGTPVQNNINDLISLVNFLNPAEFKPEWKFYKEYCNTTKSRILGILPEKLIAFKKKIDRYLINPKVDYNSFSLPKKKEDIIVTNLNKEQADIHDDYLDIAKVLIAKSMSSVLTFDERIRLNACLTKARMAANDGRLLDPKYKKSEKFYRIELLLKQLICQDKKVVVYSEWIKSLELLSPFLDAEKIPYVFFTGAMTAKKRNQTLVDFMQDPNIKVFLSTDTGGLGVDGLQLVSSDIIHIEKMWNPMKIEQRNGRLIRALQKEPEVGIHLFHTTAEIESLIGTNNIRKYSLISDVMG